MRASRTWRIRSKDTWIDELECCTAAADKCFLMMKRSIIMADRSGTACSYTHDL